MRGSPARALTGAGRGQSATPHRIHKNRTLFPQERTHLGLWRTDRGDDPPEGPTKIARYSREGENSGSRIGNGPVAHGCPDRISFRHSAVRVVRIYRAMKSYYTRNHESALKGSGMIRGTARTSRKGAVRTAYRQWHVRKHPDTGGARCATGFFARPQGRGAKVRRANAMVAPGDGNSVGPVHHAAPTRCAAGFAGSAGRARLSGPGDVSGAGEDRGCRNGQFLPGDHP